MCVCVCVFVCMCGLANFCVCILCEVVRACVHVYVCVYERKRDTERGRAREGFKREHKRKKERGVQVGVDA